MSLLDRKLWRDLATLRGQVVSIALVVAAGVAVFVASISTYDSLDRARSRFYEDTRFPDLFAGLKRAPLSIVPRMSAIPGVAVVDPRIVRDVLLDMPASALPVSARIVSLARGGDESLARLHLRSGMAPQPNDARDAVVNEAFAETNGIVPGMDLRLLLNGRVQSFRITGIGLSSEYVYAVKPGMPIPDDRSYAILWVDRSAAEAAFDMKGAFNDGVVSLAPGAEIKAAQAALDELLHPYGSVGVIERRDQPSNRFLEDELQQQRVTSVTIPLLFFGIAAFLLNGALIRQVTAQREQVATLKALGFSTAPLVLHFLKLAAVIVALGSLLGIAGGVTFGQAMIASYHGFFRLPSLDFALTPWSAAAGPAISLAAAFLGVFTAIRKIVDTPPAVAMRPPAPEGGGHFFAEKLGIIGRLRSSRMMVLRNLLGHPLRTALSIAGIALAVPMVVLGLFWRDAIDQMIDLQFTRVERGNVSIAFPHPLDRRVMAELARLPGVLVAEGERVVPVRMRAGHRSYLTSITGLRPGNELRRPQDAAFRPIEVSPEGVTLTRRLAERLGIGLGETLGMEVMEGRQLKRNLPVTAIVEETIGMGSYMEIGALNQLTGEGDVVSAATLYVEPSLLGTTLRRLKELPVIDAASVKSLVIASFMDKIANLVLVSAGILTAFAAIIAGGIVYNGARISLQERAWELASLRVLGFTRSEVAAILFGEFFVELLAALPLGVALSSGVVKLIVRLHSNESFQIPAVVNPRSFAAAAGIVLIAALASAALVRRRIDRLDLIAVLKTRE